MPAYAPWGHPGDSWGAGDDLSVAVWYITSSDDASVNMDVCGGLGSSEL